MTPLRDSRKQVLVIEDDVTFRRALCEFIEDAGYSAVAAANGRDAIEWLQGTGSPHALILLDLHVAGVDGHRFRDWQRTVPAFRSVPVVVVSAHPEASKRVDADHVLAKPIAPEQVLECVVKFTG